MSELSCPICRKVNAHRMDCENAAYVAQLQSQLDRHEQALAVAMAICDAIGSEAHNADPDSGIKYAGELVNLPFNDGRTGYAIIRDALSAYRDGDIHGKQDSEGGVMNSLLIKIKCWWYGHSGRLDKETGSFFVCRPCGKKVQM